MATVIRKYLDYEGLQSYDTQIKAWANGVNQLGYKTILKSADGNSLLLFKKAGATIENPYDESTQPTEYAGWSADTPDATVALGSADAAAKLTALANVLGATWNSAANNGEGAYTLALDSNFASGVDTALEAINELKGAVDLLNDDAETAGSVAYAIDQAIDALDVAEFALAEKDSNNVITIHGISESDGEIAVGVNSANDVVLAAVAATGDAADVSNTAINGVTKDVSGTPTATTNVQDTLEALKDLIDAGNADSTVYMTDNTSTTGTDFATIYKIYQGTGSAASPVQGELIGTINIPKDQFVDSSDLVDIVFVEATADPVAPAKLCEGSASGTDVTELIVGSNTPTAVNAGKYVKLVFAITKDNSNETTKDKSTIYISVNDLVDIYTGTTNTDGEVTVSVDSATNVITADVVKIAGTKIVYKAAYTDETDPLNPVNVPEETVVDALDGVIDELDNIGSIPTTGTNSIASLFA